jgi:16S rRNA processing protein RimM
MAYRNQILLGRITKIRGYEGVITVRLEKTFSENIPKMESVFIETEGRPVPFFISESEYTGGDIIKLKFEGYESFEKISEFSGCRVFLTSIREDIILSADIESIKGYKVVLRDKKHLGIITDIIQNPGQWLIIILSPDNKEILVPLHEDFIVSFDNKKKIIVMDIPEGLTEIN